MPTRGASSSHHPATYVLRNTGKLKLLRSLEQERLGGAIVVQLQAGARLGYALVVRFGEKRGKLVRAVLPDVGQHVQEAHERIVPRQVRDDHHRRG